MRHTTRPKIDADQLRHRLDDGAELSFGTSKALPDEAASAWAAIQDELERLCRYRSGGSSPEAWRCDPLLIEHVVVGSTVQPPSRRWTTFFVAEEARGLGLADQVLERFDRDGVELAAPESSDLATYAIMRAFSPDRLDDSMQLFQPPSQRTDLRPAASVCLVNREQRKLLLGRRLTDPYPQYWAFPGGGQEPGETALQAAVRELYEETAITLVDPQPVAVNRVYVAYRDGRRAYAIDNFLILTPSLPEAIVTAEIEPHWLDIDAAMSARPMAAGTRRVLRKVKRSLGI